MVRLQPHHLSLQPSEAPNGLTRGLPSPGSSVGLVTSPALLHHGAGSIFVQVQVS